MICPTVCGFSSLLYKDKKGKTLSIPHAFQLQFEQGWGNFLAMLMHLKNRFLNGLSPQKSFIKKFQPDQKL